MTGKGEKLTKEDISKFCRLFWEYESMYESWRWRSDLSKLLGYSCVVFLAVGIWIASLGSTDLALWTWAIAVGKAAAMSYFSSRARALTQALGEKKLEMDVEVIRLGGTRLR